MFIFLYIAQPTTRVFWCSFSMLHKCLTFCKVEMWQSVLPGCYHINSHKWICGCWAMAGMLQHAFSHHERIITVYSPILFYPFRIIWLGHQNVHAILFTKAFGIYQKYLCGNTPRLQIHCGGFSKDEAKRSSRPLLASSYFGRCVSIYDLI